MRISIVTVSFNSAITIKECINSINEQSYSNIEHIIVDGASTDNTVDIINSYAKRTPAIISEPDEGIYDAMNKGIRRATGDVIGFLNSDDTLYNKHVVKRIVESFKKNNCDCIYGNLIYSNKEGKTIRKWKSKSYVPGLFAKSWTPAHPTFYCKKEIYNQFGLYKTDYNIAADVELMLRFLEVHKINSHFIDEILVNMLAGGVSNQGLGSTITITKEIIRAFNENNLKLNLPRYLFYKSLKLKEFMMNER